MHVIFCDLSIRKSCISGWQKYAAKSMTYTQDRATAYWVCLHHGVIMRSKCQPQITKMQLGYILGSNMDPVPLATTIAQPDTWEMMTASIHHSAYPSLWWQPTFKHAYGRPRTVLHETGCI